MQNLIRACGVTITIGFRFIYFLCLMHNEMPVAKPTLSLDKNLNNYFGLV